MQPVAILKVLNHEVELIIPSHRKVVVKGNPLAVLGMVLLDKFDLNDFAVLVKYIIPNC
jgi:hypothetical protein